MIRNYIKIAWRNMVKNKIYSALNIVGLAAGMAVAMLIALWVNYQYSYDKFLPDTDRLYQVKRNFDSNGDTLTFASTSLKLANTLRTLPDVEYVAETNWGERHGFTVGEKKMNLSGLTVGGDFLKMFKYPRAQGDIKSALADPYSIVLTESTAKALFGNADPLNKLVRYDNIDNLKVTAVLKDLPSNSSFDFEYLIPFSYAEIKENWIKQARVGSYGNNSFQLFAQLKPGVIYSTFAPKIKQIEKVEKDNINSMHSNVIMQPMGDWHLYAEYKNGKAVSGFIQYVRLFSIIGGLVLLIACINFINLSTARSEKRAREVGVRKAVGSQRKDLVFQFLTESIVFVIISFALSLVLVQLVLPAFNSLTGTTITIPFASGIFWLVTVIGVLITGLLAGSRPAFYLSSFNPVKVLKGKIQAGKSASLSRRVLVVVQFSCSIVLIISTVVIYRQIQYAKNRPTGYKLSRLMTSNMTQDLDHNYQALKNDLLASGIVQSVTTASGQATSVDSHGDLDQWEGKLPGETVEMGFIFASSDYFKTLGMQMESGRDFIPNFKGDSTNIVLNQAAVKRLRLKNPVGQIITKNDVHYKVIGVVKDALMISPYAQADPTIFAYGGGWCLMYNLSPNVNTHEAVAKLTPIFNKYNPAYPYEYRFVDDLYNKKFSEEELVGKLAGLFAALAIFISCLGLFGLAAFVAEQRTKEIGIRKVLGATVTQVWLMLSKDFIVLVVISCVIASPVALYFLQKWLMKYDYRITVGPDIFIISALAAIAITLITVSSQAIRAALENPVKSLKSE